MRASEHSFRRAPAIKSSRQKQSLAERRLRVRIVIHTDEDFFQSRRSVF